MLEFEEKIEGIEDLKELIEYGGFLVNEIRDAAKRLGQLDEQYYMDWEDLLNEYSQKDPNE